MTADPEPQPEPDDVRSAIRAEFDEVVPHLVAALKRNDAFEDVARRLDRAERRLAERQQRPLVSGLRRAIANIRRYEFDEEVKAAVLGDLEGLLVGAGYTEFGEAGEPFDGERHEAISGSAPDGGAVVLEVFEPGLETLGETVVPAKVRVGPGGDHPDEEEEAP
jgi:molecular chaperone GrpE (heat shock protein)